MIKEELITVVEQNAGRTLGRVGFYNPADGQKHGEVQVGLYPHEIIISNDYKTAYVSNYGFFYHTKQLGIAGTSVSVIDIATRTEKYRLHTFDSSLRQDFSQIEKAPHEMRLRPPYDNQLYVNCEIGDKILVFDLETRMVVNKINVMPGAHKLIFSPDGKTFWLMGVGWPSLLCVDADAGEIQAEIAIGSLIRGLSWTPDNKYIMASGENEVVLIDPRTLSVYKRFGDLDVGQIIYSDITPDGKYIIAPAGFDNVVVIIDVTTGKHNRIITGYTPATAKSSLSGKFGYVTHVCGDHVTKIDLTTTQLEHIPTIDSSNGLAVVPFSHETPHKKLTLGVALPITGKNKINGHAMMAGYEFWRLCVRKAGGLWAHNQSYDIQIIYLDTMSHEANVAELTRELIIKHKVDILLGTYSPDATAHQMEQIIASENNIPIVPFVQNSNKTWEPNSIVRGEDYFVTTEAFNQLFKEVMKVDATYLSALSAASGILLQQALLKSDSLAYEELTNMFSHNHFHTFLS